MRLSVPLAQERRRRRADTGELDAQRTGAGGVEADVIRFWESDPSAATVILWKPKANAIVFKGGELLFYYYGRKKQIARHYATPKYDVIVEPFAGAASYALHSTNWKRQVILIERDHKVAEIWHWLIESATPEQILALPDLKVGERSTEFLHIVHAATKMAFKYKCIKVTPVLERNWEISKRVMAASLHKVRHWQIIEDDYTVAADIEATWFIDPPYKSSPGQGYAHSSSHIDYQALAAWARKRKGQVICCEGAFGDYLPFKRLLNLPGVAGKRSEEVVFYNSTSDQPQLSFF